MNTNSPNKKRIVLLFLTGVLLILGYLVLTDFIQSERLYPINEKTFHYSIKQTYEDPSCFLIGDNYLVFDSLHKTFSIDTFFSKQCNFTQAIILLSVTNNGDYLIYNNDNLSMNVSQDEKNNLKIIVNSKDMGEDIPYKIRLEFKTKKDFYNFFRLTTSGTKIENLDIILNRKLFGQICDQDCFSILRGDVEELPLWRGNLKSFHFNDGDVLIRTSPKSRWWLLCQKFIDAIILGLISVIIFEIFNLSFFKNDKKKILRKNRKNTKHKNKSI